MKKVPIDEHTHQKAVIKWANDMVKFQPKKYWMLEFLYAVPNGARTARSVANRLKAEGMKAGVPDLVLPYRIFHWTDRKWKTGGTFFPGVYIEMKSKDTKGRVSKDQKKWIEYLSGQGYKVEVCWNAVEAIKVLEGYLNDSLSDVPQGSDVRD